MLYWLKYKLRWNSGPDKEFSYRLLGDFESYDVPTETHWSVEETVSDLGYENDVHGGFRGIDYDVVSIKEMPLHYLMNKAESNVKTMERLAEENRALYEEIHLRPAWDSEETNGKSTTDPVLEDS